MKWVKHIIIRIGHDSMSAKKRRVEKWKVFAKKVSEWFKNKYKSYKKKYD